MVVHRGFLARAPDEAYHRNPLQRIAIQQVLQVALLVVRGVMRRQPIVMCHQIRQMRGEFSERAGFIAACCSTIRVALARKPRRRKILLILECSCSGFGQTGATFSAPFSTISACPECTRAQSTLRK